jgi:hypothetical protein
MIKTGISVRGLAVEKCVDRDKLTKSASAACVSCCSAAERIDASGDVLVSLPSQTCSQYMR